MCRMRHRRRARRLARRDRRAAEGTAPTRNVAFEAYRAETLARLEEEREAFDAFRARLRLARDREVFDRFVASDAASPAPGEA